MCFPNCYWFPGNFTYSSCFLWYTLCYYIYMDGNKVLIFVIVFQMFHEGYQTFFYSFRILIAYINIIKWGAVLLWVFNHFFLISTEAQANFVETILWSERTPSNVEDAWYFKVLFIHFLFRNIKSWCALEFFRYVNAYSFNFLLWNLVVKHTNLSWRENSARHLAFLFGELCKKKLFVFTCISINLSSGE